MYPPSSLWAEPIFLPVLLWRRHSYFNVSSSVNHFFFFSFLAQRPTEALHRFIPLCTVQYTLTISYWRPECPLRVFLYRLSMVLCVILKILVNTATPLLTPATWIVYIFRLIYRHLLTNRCLTEYLHTTALLVTMKGEGRKKKSNLDITGMQKETFFFFFLSPQNVNRLGNTHTCAHIHMTRCVNTYTQNTHTERSGEDFNDVWLLSTIPPARSPLASWPVASLC